MELQTADARHEKTWHQFLSDGINFFQSWRSSLACALQRIFVLFM